MSKLMCETCGEQMRHDLKWGYSETLVGYYSPEGHDHDDNCRVRRYACKNGHIVRVSIRRKCPVCDWKGKETCFCHDGKKFEEWPNY